jgi:hypothetical protein
VHLTWRRKSEEVLSASREVIDAFNYTIAHQSFDFIFAPIRMKSLEKFTK